jgi:choline dehydrogenase-like flavoprotein
MKDTDNCSYTRVLIVGSGSSGAVIVNRLSKYNKVLLLEAGGNPVFWSSIPALASPIVGTHSSWIDWAYKTVPQERSSFAVVDKLKKILTICL